MFYWLDNRFLLFSLFSFSLNCFSLTLLLPGGSDLDLLGAVGFRACYHADPRGVRRFSADVTRSRDKWGALLQAHTHRHRHCQIGKYQGKFPTTDLLILYWLQNRVSKLFYLFLMHCSRSSKIFYVSCLLSFFVSYSSPLRTFSRSATSSPSRKISEYRLTWCCFGRLKSLARVSFGRINWTERRIGN